MKYDILCQKNVVTFIVFNCINFVNRNKKKLTNVNLMHGTKMVAQESINICIL